MSVEFSGSPPSKNKYMKFAKGQATTVTVGGGLADLEIRGLTFKPQLVLVRDIAGASDNYQFYGVAWKDDTGCRLGSAVRNYFDDVTHIVDTSTFIQYSDGFRIRHGYYNSTGQDWIAVGW